MPKPVRVAAVLVTSIALGCDSGPSPEKQRIDTLAGRLTEVERRIGGVERGVEPVGRLNDETARLDRRLTAAESTLRDLTARGSTSTTTMPGAAHGSTTTTLPPTGARAVPPRGPAAWNNPTTREDREVRRAELRTLTHEFREKLAGVRSGRGGTPTGDTQQQTQELLQWYRDQRRAILSGQGRTDQ